MDGLQQLSAPVENSVYFLPEVLIMNTQKNPYIFSFLSCFHQATQKAYLYPEAAVEGKWEAAKEVRGVGESTKHKVAQAKEMHFP